jgi:ABC-type uncharacterized transport system YnjBCD substrate-binding protein
MKHNNIIATVAALALAFSLASASGEENSVVAKAKLTKEQASKIALKKCANGKINEGELEVENGVLIWSFDIAQPDSKNVVEVQVNAVTGAIVDVDVETPTAQAKEDAADKKEKAEAGEKDEKGEKGEKAEKGKDKD